MKSIIKRLITLILSATLFMNLSGCSKIPANESVKMTGVYFDTIITITLWGADEEILEQCKDICAHYEALLSKTVATSDISRINQAKGKPVEVDSETAELLKKGLYYSELSDGAFDITIAPLSELWDIKNNPGNIPDETAILEAKQHVNYRSVLVDGTTITLTDPDAAIDLGGIAKGFIADKLKAFLEGEGIERGLIDLGGNLLTIGSKANGEPFRIGIQKPFDERNQSITTVDIKNQSVVSSGTYERYFEKDNKIYHHLLDPKTGYPYDNNLLQVTIISNDSVDGDGLSTACFGLGLEKGSALIESLDGIKAIFLTDDYELHYAESKNP